MMPDTTSPVGLIQARESILRAARALPAERVALSDALGRVMRQDAASDVDLPPADLSLVDGFCLASASTASARPGRPVSLRVAGLVRAGVRSLASLGPGECLAITTGAAMPAGADAVVRSEDVLEREGVVLVAAPVTPGAWVSRRGEFLRRGDTVPLAGRIGSPQTLGLLAAVGAGTALVTRRPLVGLAATGDELVPSESKPRAASLRASNLPMLAGLLRRAGCDVLDRGICGDDEVAIGSCLESCRDCDAVVTTGGASAGRFDLTARAMEARGARPVFREVRLRPARRTFFGVDGGRLCFSLPGTPAAALVAFHLFVRPALAAMMGLEDPGGGWKRAGAARPMSKDRGYTQALLARHLEEGGRSGVSPVEARGGGDLPRLAQATCLIVLDEDTVAVAAGEEVEVLDLDQWDLGGVAGRKGAGTGGGCG